MGFLAATTLFLIGPLAGFIIALYLLKMRRADVPVPSTLLWQKITADMQANRPWQKLRPTWLLLLQLLALAALLFAAARPFMRATGLAGQDVAVIIDNSASMASNDTTPTRLEQSKRKAIELARSLGRGDRMLVITAASRTRAVSSLTSDKAALADAITSIEQTQLSSLMTDAIQLAQASRRGGRPLKIVVFADGSYPVLPEDIASTLDANFITIGKDAENTAITMFHCDPNRGTPTAFTRVANLGNRPRTVTVSIKLSGQLVDAKELRIEPRESAAVVTELPATQTGLVEAELSPPDALKQDDQAFALVGRPQSARLLLVSPGNVFLEQALALDPQLEVVKAAAAPSDKQLYDFDIIVWDRVNSSKPAVAAEWFIKSEGPGAPASLAGQRPPATPIWTPSASISRAADLTDMRYEGFASLQAKPWARPIAEAGGVPLIVSGEDAGVRKISFGWDYMASDLPLRVTFPILVANTISWLLGPRDTSGSYTPGEIVKLQSEGDKPAQITGPGGEKRTLAIGTSDFTETEQVGIYSWRSGNQGGKFAVNLASAEQSNLAVTGLTQQSSRLGGGSGIPRTNRELYGWLLIVGLAFLSLEWMVFHRRI